MVGCTTRLAVAQNGKEIVEQYLENTGGKKNWEAVTSKTLEGTIKMGHMTFSTQIYQKPPDWQRAEMEVQGVKIIQAYDGKNAWMVNPMENGDRAPHRMPEDLASEFKDQSFDSEFLNYKKKGHTIDLEGKEEVEGVEAYKIKLTKENGEVEYHFFDTENYLPVMMRSKVIGGPFAGQDTEMFLGNFQEVKGLVFPFYLKTKINGQDIQEITFDNIRINEEMPDSLFVAPNLK